MVRLLLAYISLQIFLSATYAQVQIASPKIVNYSNDDYTGGVQNWNVAQDKHGILYFGNNEGLVTFDGRFWKLYPLPNYTVIRSVQVDSLNRIFVGGQDEIGYFYPGKRGILQYHSLTALIPEKERKFADVWNVSIVGESVFFRAFAKIFQFKENSIRIFKPARAWDYMGSAGSQVFAHEIGKPLLTYTGKAWEPLQSHPRLDGASVTSIIPYSGDTLLITTLKDGLFLLYGKRIVEKHTSIDAELKSNRVYCSSIVNKRWIALGTMSAGLFIVDRAGNLVQRYTSEQGLQKNNIHGMLIDRNGNLWLALDGGIDFIAINSAIKFISPARDQQLTVYAISRFKDRLYIGSSSGLLSAPVDPRQSDISLSRGAFSEVKNARGQVWGLEEINNRLLLAHDEGLFIVEANVASKVYSAPGTWIFQPVSDVFPSAEVLAGTYWGLQKIQFNGPTVKNAGHIDGLFESLRFLVYDNAANVVWASHPNRGVFRIELDSQRKKIAKYALYTKASGLPSSEYNYVFRIRNRIVIATEDGAYEFGQKNNKFIPSPTLYGYTKGVNLQYMREDNEGNVWFVSNKKVAVIDFTLRSGPAVIQFPELNGKVVGGFESIYPLNSNNVFIGGTRGVFLINYRKYKETLTKPDIVLSSVRSTGRTDTVIFGGYFVSEGMVGTAQDRNSRPRLSHKQNSLHFEYSSTFFQQQSNIEFSYQLEGFEQTWSSWSRKAEKDYTNLSPGEYVFKVKARNSPGNESYVISYSFVVEPAWYQTVWMYTFYVLVLVLVVFAVLKGQRKKHLKTQEKLNYLHQLELDRSEKEIVRLKNDQLEADVNYKNRELASMTMHLIQRGEVLSKVKEAISALVKKNEGALENSASVKQLLRLIREVERKQEDWEQFTIHFNQVNSDFFAVLKDRYPELTSNELKLCAYLKMNLSSKEIAQLMNITGKAIEVGRYRLRKKLKLSPDTNLYDFLMKVSKDAKQNPN
ncbi:triple tyrosine motif-containing protein [Arcticibacter sp. MXS-1]|uniref:triple tyrosine motif-containing protein n=1 Tax=Arcticibacter sp. MXS-1 TaxID=3341726 RepID=UPI0035A93A83